MLWDRSQLLTERLLLRRFRWSDSKELYGYLSRPEVVRFEPYGVFSRSECRREARQRARHPAFWALCLRDTGELIGNLYFPRREPEIYRTWEIGYVLHPDFQGKGYATEAAQRMLEYGFLTKQAHRIVARCDPRNSDSWRLLERLGMRREAHAVKSAWFDLSQDGEPLWHDTYLYAILAEEWFRQIGQLDE